MSNTTTSTIKQSVVSGKPPYDPNEIQTQHSGLHVKVYQAGEETSAILEILNRIVLFMLYDLN